MKKSSSKRPRPKKDVKRRRRATKIIKLLFLAGAELMVLLAAYGFYLSAEIDKRFSGRRWSIPSKVFSDTTLLYPGQPIQRVSLEKKL